MLKILLIRGAVCSDQRSDSVKLCEDRLASSKCSWKVTIYFQKICHFLSNIPTDTSVILRVWPQFFGCHKNLKKQNAQQWALIKPSENKKVESMLCLDSKYNTLASGAHGGFPDIFIVFKLLNQYLSHLAFIEIKKIVSPEHSLHMHAALI